MGRFASAERQARSVMKAMQGKDIKSVGTVRNYEQALTRVTEYVKEHKLGSLRDMTQERAVTYLEQRGQQVGQKTLDMERQAIQKMMQCVTQKLNPAEKLPAIKSELEQALTGRAYTPQQVECVVQHQLDRNALATEIAYNAGLRAHELFTLRPVSEQKADIRPASENKFKGREGVLYTVAGKGGLVREVLISQRLSERLEATRLAEPRSVTDRNIRYQQHYNIAGGQRWSNSFSAAATRSLGWSAGGHGVRHTYAQERMDALQKSGLLRKEALETVSQELGHFRPEIAEVYLR